MGEHAGPKQQQLEVHEGLVQAGVEQLQLDTALEQEDRVAAATREGQVPANMTNRCEEKGESNSGWALGDGWRWLAAIGRG